MIRTPAMRGVRGVALALVVGVAAARAEVVNRIVATIDGEPVTAFEVAKYRAQLGDQPVTDQQILEAIVTERLLEKEAAARGIKATPEDVVRLRRTDPADAARWRRQVREELGGRMAAGATVVGFTRDGPMAKPTPAVIQRNVLYRMSPGSHVASSGCWRTSIAS